MGSGWSQTFGCSREADELDITEIGTVATPSVSTCGSFDLSFSQASKKGAHEMTTMEGIRWAAAIRDRKEYQLRSAALLYDSLGYEVDRTNCELVLLEEQYKRQFGEAPPSAEEGQPRAQVEFA